MPEPKHKVKASKKKTIIDKLKGSAFFILFMILVFSIDIILIVAWLSGVLNGSNTKIVDRTFWIWVGISGGLVVFFLLAWFIQRRAHGSGTRA